MIRISVLLSLFILTSCAGMAPSTAPLALKPASFRDLPGWNNDRQEETVAAFARSCDRIMKRGAGEKFGPVGGTYGDWQPSCQALQANPPQTASAARQYFETWFTPWKATGGGSDEGLFTGYYEASLKGSRTKHGSYQTPLRLRPEDLVMVDLGEFRDELKGQRIAGRVKQGHLKPYEDRKAISEGKLPDDGKISFVYVDDPVDAFFLQVQGSGRIDLDDGTVMSVGYDGQNGWPYYAVGRELVRRGEMGAADVSMQSIRAWLSAHPDQAADFMNTNKSYVFFKTLDGDGPLGGEGVALTPLRSLAIDRGRLSYGIPLWAAIEPPAAGEAPIRRLMVAQDTGGAIQGPVRGDFFWGYGPRAETMAGLMKAQGRYWLLLPRTVRPVS